jgi:hypothetical protein
VVTLKGGETRRIDLTVAAHDKRQEVEAMERLIRRIQKEVRPRVSRQILKRLSGVAG